MWRAIALGLLAGTLLGSVVTVRAYNLLPSNWKLPSSQFTVSCGNATLIEAAQQWDSVSDLEFMGCSANPTIELRVIDPWPYTDRGGQCALSPRRIELRPEYADDLVVMVHELGHCVGLAHSVQSGVRVVGDSGPVGAVMHWNPCSKVPGAPGPNVGPCNTMNADDIAGIRALYGPFPSPTASPPRDVTQEPTETPTPTPTATRVPTQQPTNIPTATAAPTVAPVEAPTQHPTVPFPYRLFAPGVQR